LIKKLIKEKILQEIKKLFGEVGEIKFEVENKD